MNESCVGCPAIQAVYRLSTTSTSTGSFTTPLGPAIPDMYHVMECTQKSYDLSERLIRTISNWRHTQHDTIEDLIQLGASVNQLHGTLLPLHCACMVGDEESAKILLSKGAKVNATDGYGRASLHYAVERESGCVELLLDHGASINVLDGNRDTPLHWAAFRNNHRNVRLLLARGADVNARDFNDDSAASWAAMKGHYESIVVLLDHNAPVDCCNNNGATPLLRCASIHSIGLNQEEDNKSLELLIQATGYFRMRDALGKLPGFLESDADLRRALLPHLTNPRSLKELSRHYVRRSLGRACLPRVVVGLPLPASLKHYLLFKDTES